MRAATDGGRWRHRVRDAQRLALARLVTAATTAASACAAPTAGSLPPHISRSIGVDLGRKQPVYAAERIYNSNTGELLRITRWPLRSRGYHRARGKLRSDALNAMWRDEPNVAAADAAAAGVSRKSVNPVHHEQWAVVKAAHTEAIMRDGSRPARLREALRSSLATTRTLMEFFRRMLRGRIQDGTLGVPAALFIGGARFTSPCPTEAAVQAAVRAFAEPREPRNRGIVITDLDEFRSTQSCNSCGSPMWDVIDGRRADTLRVLHGLKWCPLCCVFRERDENASLNHIDAGVGEMLHGGVIGRPTWMQRPRGEGTDASAVPLQQRQTLWLR